MAIEYRAAVDADFNAASRQIEGKVDIYFEATPVTIMHDDYLIDFSVLEEICAESNTPLGKISANELEVTLLNPDNRFNPQNTTGPYYGLIKTGIRVDPFVRVVSPTLVSDWIPLGVFYVRDWFAEMAGVTASIYTTDKLETALAASTDTVEVQQSVTFKAFLENIFTVIGVTASVDASLTQNIPAAFAAPKPGQFLDTMVAGAMAMCYCNRAGSILVRPYIATRSLRATITDADQIVDMKAKQSVLKTYDGVSLTWQFPQFTPHDLLLDIQNYDIAIGAKQYSDIEFDKSPVAAVESVATQTKVEDVLINSFSYTPWKFKVSLTNSTAAVIQTMLSVYGISVELTATEIKDEGTSLLDIKNDYIQTEEYATTYKSFLSAFVVCDIPTITITTRGNPLLLLGEKITASSAMYDLTYTGIIQRIKHKFSGHYASTITLMNIDIVE